jgi:hypothetical protein
MACQAVLIGCGIGDFPIDKDMQTPKDFQGAIGIDGSPGTRMRIAFDP